MRRSLRGFDVRPIGNVPEAIIDTACSQFAGSSVDGGASATDLSAASTGV